MAIPETNFDPPFNVTRASHVRLASPDLGASRAFYEEVVGLLVSDADKDTVYMRGVEILLMQTATTCERIFKTECRRTRALRRA